MIHPMILKHKGKILALTPETIVELTKKPRPILWCNDGLYGILPIERIKNFLSILKDRSVYIKSFKWHFLWNEVVEIPQETGRTMEQYAGGGK